MPNHVTSVCTVRGSPSDVARFVEKHIVRNERGRRELDFETVIPMPARLREVTASNDTENGMFALAGVQQDPLPGFASLPMNPLAYSWAQKLGIKTREDFRAWLEKNRPEAIGQARAALRNIADYDYPTWYEWSCARWGTKWNSYDFEERERSDGQYVFQFDTAWSFPKPIFEKLHELYPEVIFSVLAYDECSNFACVGEFGGKNDFRTVKATPELYEAVYGRKQDEEEADEDEEEAAS
jgi:hypothetical protein